MFGRGMARDGEMPRRPAYVLAGVGAVGVLVALVGLA
jgi:hypothetical protein